MIYHHWIVYLRVVILLPSLFLFSSSALFFLWAVLYSDGSPEVVDACSATQTQTSEFTFTIPPVVLDPLP